jgi:hypothetical protein
MRNTQALLSFCLLLGMVVASGCNKAKPTESSPEVKPNPHPEPGKKGVKDKVQGTNTNPPKSLGDPQLKVAAADFHAEFRGDFAAAQAKYGGKVIELTGTVHGARATQRGWIDLSAPEKGTVPCEFEDVSVTGKVAKRQTIRVKGWARPTSTSPTLTQCEIVELGPDTSLKTTSEKLAADITVQREQTLKASEGRTTFVTGSLEGRITDENMTEQLVLKGDGKTRIQCQTTDPRAKNLQPGQIVTFAGELREPFGKSDRISVWDAVLVENPKK